MGAGGAVVALGAGLALRNLRRGCPQSGPRRGGWLAAFLWACFGVGLLLQGSAPHLQIERNAWVIPGELAARGEIDPRSLIDRERHTQLLAAVLTAGAALGLLFCYRDAFRLRDPSPGPRSDLEREAGRQE